MNSFTNDTVNADDINNHPNTFMNQIIRISINDSRKLKRFIWRFEHNEENIEDIIQDAVIEALRCEHSFEYRSSVETWFFGVAANVARRHVARRSVHSKRVTSLDDHAEWTEFDGMDGLPCESSTPDGAFQFNQFVSDLSTQIEQFPADLRRTFELVCIEGNAYQDAAAMLQIPIGTVRSRVNRARKLLQQTQVSCSKASAMVSSSS